MEADSKESHESFRSWICLRIKKLEQKIDMDEKMKKMGDMQLSAVTD